MVACLAVKLLIWDHHIAMDQTQKPLQNKSFWAYVTIFGALWGGIELTLGTFLHVLHVPKTGLIMTTLTVILLIAQRVIFPYRGATLASAIIAACIKCLSPGGIILGPVVGILSEALMLEIGLMLTSRSLATAMIAGTLAIFSCQLQSLFKLWIYYGNDFVRALIKIAEKFFNIHWTAAIGWSLLGGLLAVFIAIGCIAGATGYFSGRRVLRQLDEEKNHVAEAEAHASSDETLLPKASAESEAPSEGETSAETPRSPWIPRSKRNPADTARVVATRKRVFPFVILTIALQFLTVFFEHPLLTDLNTMLAALVIMLTVLALWARPVLKSIWWPKFWILTIVVSLLAGLILAWQFDGSFEPMVAVSASGHMIARGIYVFMIVLWMTRCVRSDEFDSICKKIHLPQLGESLKQAYLILPTWIDCFNGLLASRPKGFRNTWHYCKESAVNVLVQATRDAEKNTLSAKSDPTADENPS